MEDIDDRGIEEENFERKARLKRVKNKRFRMEELVSNWMKETFEKAIEIDISKND